MNPSLGTVRFTVRWFASRTVRRAVELRRQVWRILNEQRDQLPPEAMAAVGKADRELAQILQAHGDPAALRSGMTRLEQVANESLLPYPHGALRENIKEVLVAATVIFAFTTFFLQLTKIPTNSLVPTLYGITVQDLRNEPGFEIPGRLARFFQYWTRGVSYHHVVARAAGPVEEIEPPKLVVPFVKKQRLRVGGVWYTLWFPPERLEGLPKGHFYRAGEDILKLKVVAGDHLLVDRLTYNFRRPQRGEIFVFKTRRIVGLPEGQLYIKRLVALPGERVRIGDDQHLVINGTRLDASTPRFENVYTFPPDPRDNHYFGHVNGAVAERNGRWPGLARLFPDERCEYQVGPRHYLAMGDNTLNSSDSRTWGDVPRENVIGKCWFVYWPLSERFGWGVR